MVRRLRGNAAIVQGNKVKLLALFWLCRKRICRRHHREQIHPVVFALVLQLHLCVHA
jgi:hypothetical protein